MPSLVVIVPMLVATQQLNIFYVTLQDYVIEWSGAFIGGNSSWHIAKLPKLITIDIVLIDI